MIDINSQPTPNPLAIKYLVDRPFKTTGKATFTKPSESIGVRLAEDLFMLDGVRQLHFFENALTITFAEEVDPSSMDEKVRAVLQTRLASHNPDFITEVEKKAVDRSQLSPDLRRIEEILDETVRMYLQGDGGDIEVLSYSDHKLLVRYQGACGTCPSSTAATLDAILGILREKFDPDIDVVPVG